SKFSLLQPNTFNSVMGPTGSGKSTFINLATGIETDIGHGLQSRTSGMNIYKLEFPGLSSFNLVFIDTPGFDDTHLPDIEILRLISDWLSKTFKNRVLLSGLLYLHRISDNRMAGTPLKNLRMFEKLCGEKMLHNVILTTTMWEEVDEKTGRIRENELKSNFWHGMIHNGSTTCRLEKQTQAAAFKVLEPLLDRAVERNSLLIQDELVKMHMTLPETAAGQTLSSELKLVLKKQHDILRKIRH
ncbi:P-loop containing nucleoside triphosphate hydrolase protein, partial [Gymnopilus junonius]